MVARIKSEIFTDEQNEIALLSKAMAHPARVAIIQYLAAKNSCVCGDIVNEIGLAQSTISQHLKELKNVGLIQGEIEGVKVCYCINQNQWKRLEAVLSKFIHLDVEVKKVCK